MSARLAQAQMLAAPLDARRSLAARQLVRRLARLRLGIAEPSRVREREERGALGLKGL
jgi:hypothetical protein